MRKCEELVASPEAEEFARSHGILTKKFYDEVFPLAVFAQREYHNRTDVIIYANLGNDNFDARIVSGLPLTSITTFVEITYAKNGYDDSRRMEVLKHHGHVSLTGSVSSHGRRGSPNRLVSVEDEAIRHDKFLAKILALVETRLHAKAGAQYGTSHILVVAVDDHLPFRNPEDAEALAHRASNLLQSLSLDFHKVVFVGVAGHLFESFIL
jgi:hypothetical protein